MEKRMGGGRQYRVKPGLRDMNNSGARYTALCRGSRAASRFLRRSIKSSKRADSPRIKENTCRLSINPPCFHRWMERWRKTSGKGEARAIIHSRQLLPPSPSCCVMAKTNDPLIRSARDNRGVTRTCFLLFLFFFFFPFDSKTPSKDCRGKFRVRTRPPRRYFKSNEPVGDPPGAAGSRSRRGLIFNNEIRRQQHSPVLRLQGSCLVDNLPIRLLWVFQRISLRRIFLKVIRMLCMNEIEILNRSRIGLLIYSRIPQYNTNLLFIIILKFIVRQIRGCWIKVNNFFFRCMTIVKRTIK